MKIIFLCGSLEPGRDGVGDYTRRLAGELIRQGQHVAAVALNDHYLVEEFTGMQPADDINLPVIRIPAAWPKNRRFDRAKNWIKKFNPEWLSLQFVPFAFHPKGLPFNINKQLLKLSEGICWHIMFHELWVGMNKESGMKMLIWGHLQKQLIKALVLNLKPRIINTQTKLYQVHLLQMGFEAEYLPLFSNIPPSEKGKKNGLPISTSNDLHKPIRLVLFGSIHPGAPVDQFAKEASQFAKVKNVQVILIFLGRCGQEQYRWEEAWKVESLLVEVLGEQPPAVISDVLNNSTMGISTTPLILVDKSGTVAAMREHGLPVLNVSRSWQARGVSNLYIPADILKYEPGNLEACLLRKPNSNWPNNVTAVAHQLVDSFLNS
jgi:hypothetical protein